MNRVRSLLRMCVMLLRCSFESRPNSCALSTAGSIITIGSSMNGCSHLKNNSLARENKIDWSRRLGGGDHRQSLLFSSLLKKTKVGSARAQGVAASQQQQQRRQQTQAFSYLCLSYSPIKKHSWSVSPLNRYLCSVEVRKINLCSFHFSEVKFESQHNTSFRDPLYWK